MKGKSEINTPRDFLVRDCALAALLAALVLSSGTAPAGAAPATPTPAVVSGPAAGSQTSLTAASPIPETGPLPNLENLLETVRTANAESAAALKSGSVTAFALAARMAPDYREVSADGGIGMSRDDILQRERALMAGNRYTDIETGITSLALIGANTATLTLWRRVTYVSVGTPSSLIKTPQGTRVINNMQRFTRTQLLEQRWQQDKGTWLLSRCRIVRDATVGVL